MPKQIWKVTELIVGVEDKPGAFARVAEVVANGGVNLMAAVGYVESPGVGRIILVPQDTDKAKEALKKAGIADVEIADAVLVQGDDRIGAGRDLAQKIAEKGINVRALNAQALGGKYQALIRVASEDVDKVLEILG